MQNPASSFCRRTALHSKEKRFEARHFKDISIEDLFVFSLALKAVRRWKIEANFLGRNLTNP
jgi:hypothetical protein